MNRIGLQLHTVRTELQKDFEGTLARVAMIGYQEVELAGLCSRTARDFRNTLDRYDLAAPAGHVGIENLGGNWPGVLEDAHILGHRFIVIPGIGRGAEPDIDGWKRIAHEFNRAGETSAASGIRLAFHNHAGDFMPVGGKIPYDILLEECDPSLVDMELDIYWVIAGGQDPIEYFRKHPGRFPLLHMKDVVEVAPPSGSLSPAGAGRFSMTEVGSGKVDWPAVISHAATQGAGHCFVEHDHPDDPIGSISKSFTYLQNIHRLY